MQILSIHLGVFFFLYKSWFVWRSQTLGLFGYKYPKYELLWAKPPKRFLYIYSPIYVCIYTTYAFNCLKPGEPFGGLILMIFSLFKMLRHWLITKWNRRSLKRGEVRILRLWKSKHLCIQQIGGVHDGSSIVHLEFNPIQDRHIYAANWRRWEEFIISYCELITSHEYNHNEISITSLKCLCFFVNIYLN